MKGYSEDRWFYYRRLTKKYVENPVYTVTKNQMREAIYIEWDNCSKCMMTKPHVQKWCEENWYEFQVVRFDDTSVEEFQIESVPMLVLKTDWVVDQILDMDWIVALISNQHKDG